MKKTQRAQKISRLIQKELGIILNYISEITTNHLVSITHVETSKDLRISNVHISILLKENYKNKENEKNVSNRKQFDGIKYKENTLCKLEENKPLIRKILGEKIRNKMRNIPHIRFYLDNSYDNVIKIEKLLIKSNKVDF